MIKKIIMFSLFMMQSMMEPSQVRSNKAAGLRAKQTAPDSSKLAKQSKLPKQAKTMTNKVVSSTRTDKDSSTLRSDSDEKSQLTVSTPRSSVSSQDGVLNDSGPMSASVDLKDLVSPEEKRELEKYIQEQMSDPDSVLDVQQKSEERLNREFIEKVLASQQGSEPISEEEQEELQKFIEKHINFKKNKEEVERAKKELQEFTHQKLDPEGYNKQKETEILNFIDEELSLSELLKLQAELQNKKENLSKYEKDENEVQLEAVSRLISDKLSKDNPVQKSFDSQEALRTQKEQEEGRTHLHQDQLEAHTLIKALFDAEKENVRNREAFKQDQTKKILTDSVKKGWREYLAGIYSAVLGKKNSPLIDLDAHE
jgi:hypothetical protein